MAFEARSRPNTINQSTADVVLNKFKLILPDLQYVVSEGEQLFVVPPSNNSVDGIARLPVLNVSANFATAHYEANTNPLGQPIGLLQVVNNYNFRGDSAPSLSLHSPAIAKPQRLVTKRQSKTRSYVQQTLIAPLAQPRCIRIPRCANCVRDVLRWWVRADRVVSLQKGLMYWTKEERNNSWTVNDKEVTNRYLYSKRKKTALAFFHFCQTHTVVHYTAAFTSISDSNVVRRNLELSSMYVGRQKLLNIYQNCDTVISLCERMLDRSDIKTALNL